MRGRVLLHAEALAALALAALLIAALPFRRVMGALRADPAAPPIDAAAARRIERALARIAGRVPFHAMCFQQGLAAHLMLRRRGRATRVHYGARHDADGRLIAHVWVRSGDVDVVGCNGADRYAPLATFPPGA